MKYSKMIVVVVLALVVGFLLGHGCTVRPKKEPALAKSRQTEIWTCSMHPQIRQPKPGKCPICGMDLIVVANDDAAEADQPRQVTLSPAARALAEIAVVPVERRSVAVEIRMVGKVQFDETRLAYISPRVPGRIDRLYANFTGVPVKAGDHLADMYCPDLVSAQQELLLAAKASGGTATPTSLLNATRERLRLWGLSAEQIAEVERNGQVRDHVTFYAPIGGIVVKKEAREGMYVETGMRLFTIADLTHVWVQLDAYESDLTWLRYAQEVTFEAAAYAGETFKGTIAFIDPLLDPMTRTVKVRVNVTNADGRLKPEMFVHAVVHATMAVDGQVERPDLRGKWISPMHPEIIKDAPGTCDVCGMPLVRAEDLGYTATDKASAVPPLVIPVSAPLLTGKRAVVYVALPQREGAYEGREVVLGPRAGEYYLVREGLQEGEQVVVNGAFKIDSSLQIQGKPSMMAPDGNSAPAGHPHDAAAPTVRSEARPTVASAVVAPEVFRKQIDAVLSQVLLTADALADDNLDASLAGASHAKQALASVDMTILTGIAHVRWMQSLDALSQPLGKMVETKDIESFRLAFAALSSELVRIVKMFGPIRSEPIYALRCPMAFDNRGATWLQQDKAVRNPYFGKAMPTCGDVIDTIQPAASLPVPRSGRQEDASTKGGNIHE